MTAARLPLEREYVLDTQILLEASRAASELGYAAADLLFAIADRHRVAVDDGDKILAEYYDNLRPGMLGLYWLKRMTQRKRLSYRSGQLSNYHRLALDSVGFDPSDRVFVGVARRTAQRLLVAEERHFWNSRCHQCLRQKIGIALLRAAEACAHARE
jgi:hypothetical protein